MAVTQSTTIDHGVWTEVITGPFTWAVVENTSTSIPVLAYTGPAPGDLNDPESVASFVLHPKAIDADRFNNVLAAQSLWVFAKIRPVEIVHRSAV